MTDALTTWLYYASLGWHLLMVHSIREDGSCTCGNSRCLKEAGKHPILSNGQKSATSNPQLLESWAKEYPWANIAIALAPSGLISFDIDEYKGDHLRLLAMMGCTHAYPELPRLGLLPPTIEQISGSGQGRHLTYWAPPHLVSGQIGNITIRGNNYIILAPSRHKSGGQYRWEDGCAPGEIEIATLPQAWADALRRPDPVGEVGVLSVEDEPEWLRKVPHEARVSGMREHLQHETGERMGVDRPGMAWDVARTAARGYAVRDPNEVFHALVEIYNPKCNPPYSEAKLGDRVASAYEEAHTPEWGDALKPHDARMRDDGLGWIFDTALPGSTRGEVVAALKAARNSMRGSTDTKRVLWAGALASVLAGDIVAQPTDGSVERDAAHRIAVEAIVHTAPVTAPTNILVEILAPSLPSVAPDGIARMVREARVPIPAAAVVTPGDATDADLRGRLLMTEKGPRACGANVSLILKHAKAFTSYLKFNELTKAVEVHGGPFASVSPSDLPIAISNWLSFHWDLNVSTFEVGEQIRYVSRACFAYDPVATYLNSLTWDRTPRLDTWLETYCQAHLIDRDGDVSSFVRKAGARWMISAVARALAPGSKVDTVLVLEGAQGSKKSTALSILGGEWFSDTPLILGDKDSRMLAAARWICELAELASLVRSDVESQKAFLSARKDDFRPPYGRAIETFERRCVFAGTINPTKDGEVGYLIDETGDRRWWPVRVGRINEEILRRDRDQLWAEAAWRYAHVNDTPHPRCPGERWWFEDEEQLEADHVASHRHAESPWADLLVDWARREMMTPSAALGLGPTAPQIVWTLPEIAKRALGIEASDLKHQEKAIGSALRDAGFCRKRVQVGDRRPYMWFRPSAIEVVEPDGNPAPNDASDSPGRLVDDFD